jgi:rRNA maturation RNase YbeY
MENHLTGAVRVEEKIRHRSSPHVLILTRLTLSSSFDQRLTHQPGHQLNDFPLPEGFPPHLGDIVVSFPEAVNNARKYGKMVDDQICFFIEHGMMHLLGYHHDD